MAHAPETSRSGDTAPMRAEGEISAADAQLEGAAAIAARLAANIELVLRGKHDEIKLVIAALACHGHVLFEDVPGTGKTVLARAIARSIEDSVFARVQCTPDLQPSDVTGVNIYDQKLRDFEFRRGPLFANVVLVDEINRAMPKTQSALLEAMAERQVTIDGQTYVLPQPFLVLATENPIEFEGVFPLPEAQLDRFFLKARLGYPDEDEELGVILDQQQGHPLDRLQPVVGVAHLAQLEAALSSVYVDDLVRRWTIKLVRSTRELPEISIGASVRGSLALERASRAWALLDGRSYTTPEDVERMFAPVLGPPPRVLADVHRRVARPVEGGDPRRGLPSLRGARPAARARGEVEHAELAFPLVPRWRPVGSAFGRLRAARRGLGSSVATTRPYRPGDDPGMIDWKLSARLSSIRGDAEFLVREDFADEAPRAVFVGDRSPSMSLYPDDLPWLSKPAALRSVWSAVAAASVQELGLAGYLDTAPGEAWLPPRSSHGFDAVEERLGRVGFDGPAAGIDAAFEQLILSRRSLPAGTFVFVCSDFLAAPRPETWLRALGHRWDVVPVVVQDPVWEQSFPLVDGLVIPFADPATGRLLHTRVSRKEALRRREANEARLAGLLRRVPQPRPRLRRHRGLGAANDPARVHRLGRGAHREPAG